ncbi:glycosyltransferase family 4 protein [Planctomycetes bacterium K23_9]|uniref:glycosyltransferase family 4 protein n=1 Tax=Stieleria marina TaxID=1930275 RepID=UPI0011A14F33
MKIVYLTAGAAGMYCGSCMHDNQLAGALRGRGVDCVLQPLYTPIRTDGKSVAQENVFFGGIQVYLLQQMPWLRFLPTPLLRMLDWPPLIRWATARASSTDAAKLGALSVSMLQGSHGYQAAEVRRLTHWMANEMRPDAIVLTNLLIGGALPEIRSALPNTKIAVVLQGDDIFLDHLPPKFRDEAISLCSGLIQEIDHVIVNSKFYGEKMGAMLSIPKEKIVVTPLSIDLAPFDFAPQNAEPVQSNADDVFRLGYLARIAPEKGLHHLVDAFVHLASQKSHSDLELHVAGWLGESNRAYFDQLQTRIADAGLADRFYHHGSPDLNEKIAFLRKLDLLSVPTDYEDPKGLFVLEALAAGVPVVQPNHGAFGELIQSTGGGVTFTPGDAAELAGAIEKLKLDIDERLRLGQIGHAGVHARHSIENAAQHLIDVLD